MAQSGDLFNNCFVTQAAFVGDVAGLGTGGVLDQSVAHIVAHIDGGGDQLSTCLLVRNGVGTDFVSLEHTVDIGTQAAFVGVQLGFVDTDSAVLCAGLDILVNDDTVDLCLGQLLQLDLNRDLVLAVLIHNDQIGPVCGVAGKASLAAVVSGEVAILGYHIGVQDLQTVLVGDHGVALDTGVEGEPLADNSGLFQLEDSPCAVVAGAPLTGLGAVKHIGCFLAGVCAAGDDVLDGQSGVDDVAQSGTLGGILVGVAVLVGDGDSDTAGGDGLHVQVILVDPVSVKQIGCQSAAGDGVGGGVPVVQQLQGVVIGTVMDDVQSFDGVLLHSGLLIVVVEAHGSDIISVDSPVGPCFGIAVVDDLDELCVGVFGNGNSVFSTAVTGDVSQFGIGATVRGDLDGKVTQVAVVVGASGPQLQAVEQVFLTQIDHVVDSGIVEVDLMSVLDHDGLAADLLDQVSIFEVFLHACHELALSGGLGQVHLGTGPLPVVSIGVGGCVSSSQGRNLAGVDGEVVQLDVGGDVQLGHLGAGQVQILQLGAAGQIQGIIAVAVQGQVHQSGQVTQDHFQLGLAVQLDGLQVLAVVQSDLLDAGGQHGSGQLGKCVAAEIDLGNAGQGGQTGQILNAQVGQIQRIGVVDQILQGGANDFTDGFQQSLVGEAVGAVLSGHVSNLAVHEHQGSGGGSVAIDIGHGDDNAGHAGGADIDALQSGGAETVQVSLAAVDDHGHDLPVALQRQREVKGAVAVSLRHANIGIAVLVDQLAEVVDKAIVIGQGQDVILAVFHIDVEGDGAVAGLGSGSDLVGVEVLQLDLSLAAVPGDDQLVVSGSGHNIADAVVAQSDLRASALRAVDADSAELQSDHVLAVFQSLDVVVFSVGAADETLGAVSVDGVDVVVVDAGVVRDVPGDLDLVGVIELLLQLHAGGSSGSVVVAVGDFQITQVDLIVFNSLGGGQLHADGGDDLTGILAQIHGGGGPAGLLAGIGDGQNNGLGLIAVLEGNSNADLGSVVSGGLVISQGDFGICGDIQLGLVQVDHVGVVQVAVDNDGVTAVVSADLGVGECALVTGELGAVVPIHIQSQSGALGFHPPLPGGQNGLDVQVGPLHITGDFTVNEVLHAVAGGEVGGEDSAVDDGLLNNILGEALEVDGAGIDIVTGHSTDGVGACVLSGGGEVHTLTLFHVPLILGLIAVVVGAVILVLIPVGAPDSEGGIGLVVLVNSIVVAVQVSAELPLATLDAHVDDLVGVQTQGLSVSLGILQGGAAVPVVQEDGIGNTAVLFVPDPAVVVVVELILVGDGAAVANGVIPLDVGALLAHPLQHIPEQGDIVRGDVLFLVDEVAVEAIVVHDVDELLGVGIVAVLVLVQPLLRDLRNTGGEVLSQGQNAVHVGGVGGGSLGNGDGAVLEGADQSLGLGIDLLGGTAACTGHVGVLPELEQVHAEVFVCHAAVPGTVAGVGVTVAGRGDGVQTGLIQQPGVSLSCGEGADAVLQGDLGDQFVGVVVSCGIPVQDIDETVAVAPGFVGGAGLSGSGLFGCGSDMSGQQRQDHGKNHNEGQHSLQILHNSLQKLVC